MFVRPVDGKRPSVDEHQHYRFSRGRQFLQKQFLMSRQIQTGAALVLTAGALSATENRYHGICLAGKLHRIVHLAKFLFRRFGREYFRIRPILINKLASLGVENPPLAFQGLLQPFADRDRRCR